MRDKFVTTENAKRFIQGVSKLNERGAEEACLMVVDGIPGLGKTHMVHWWATQNGCVYLRAKKEWTANWMMAELLETIGVVPSNSYKAMYRQALEKLATESEMAAHNNETYGVVIDEIDHIARRESLLESLRDLSYMLEIPFIFVGMGRVRHSLTRFPQIASRVGQFVEFQPVQLEDVAKMVKELCETEVKDDLIAYLHKISNGLVREIKEGINSIERFGKTNDGPIGLNEMNGQVLLNDRKTGRPIGESVTSCVGPLIIKTLLSELLVRMPA